MAVLEQSQYGFCCSKDECAANCEYTEFACDPEGKPHDAGLLTTTDTPTLVKNLASRLIALAHNMDVPITRGRVPPTPPDKTKGPGKQPDEPKKPPTGNGDNGDSGLSGPPTSIGY